MGVIELPVRLDALMVKAFALPTLIGEVDYLIKQHPSTARPKGIEVPPVEVVCVVPPLPVASSIFQRYLPPPFH